MKIERIYEGETAAIIGTGPSITPEQIAIVDRAGWVKFGANRAFIFDLDVLVATNGQFWDMCWADVRDLRCQKWTTDHAKALVAAKRYGLNVIPERHAPGLSTDPGYIHHHHGSGPIAVNLALHFGIKKMCLLGWDMQFRGKIDRHTYTGKRRYFGEDAVTKTHWPMTGPNGELTGLINEMATINPDDYGIDIVNCTPGSAMHCFRMADLETESTTAS